MYRRLAGLCERKRGESREERKRRKEGLGVANEKERELLRSLGLSETSENTQALHKGADAIRKRMEREGVGR